MKPNLWFAPFQDILTDPRYFPVRLDIERDCLTLIETSRLRLAAAPFLDGRTPIADGDAIEVSLSEALRTDWHIPAEPNRFLFNVGFCGSTLLSNLLDVEGHSFAQREPSVLVDLANERGSARSAWLRQTLDLVLALLRRTWRPREHVMCKLPSWANNLIPLLTATPDRVSPLFMVTDQRSYLRSVFRGGRARMDYVVRATDHLLETSGANAGLWDCAVKGARDPLEIVGRLALVSLDIQLRMFHAAMLRGGWGQAHLMTFDQISEDPRGASQAAAKALDLSVPAAMLEESIARNLGRYSKRPERPYCHEATSAQNRQLERDHGEVMSRALEWARDIGLKGECAAAGV